jgi:DNA polymerase V
MEGVRTVESDIQKYSRIPLFTCTVSAGFPSPADDWLEGELDLLRFLIKHPAATFYVRVSGDSMIGAGIHQGDILIVDRACKPTTDDIVIASINGELTVKRLVIRKDKILLMPENPTYKPIEITEEMGFETWGKVLHVIHSV